MLTPGTLITIFHPTNGCEIVATIDTVEVLGKGRLLYHLNWNTDNGPRKAAAYTHEIISIVEKIMVFQELED